MGAWLKIKPSLWTALSKHDQLLFFNGFFRRLLLLFPTGIRKLVRPGQQVVEIGQILKLPSLRDFFKQILEVFVRFQVVRLRSLGQAVPDRAGLGPADGIYHLPVFLAQAEWTDSSFSGLCECSHKLRYPQELLIRIFCRKAA